MPASDTIEAQGHLIDSGLLSAIFDKIIEHNAAYEILKFDIGRTNDDVSEIEMRITAADQVILDDLLQQLTTFGCHPMRERDALVKPLVFVVLRPGVAPTPARGLELERFVRAQLAEYKRPRWVTFVAELPKTATGKIQRFKLRELAGGVGSSGSPNS